MKEEVLIDIRKGGVLYFWCYTGTFTFIAFLYQFHLWVCLALLYLAFNPYLHEGVHLLLARLLGIPLSVVEVHAGTIELTFTEYPNRLALAVVAPAVYSLTICLIALYHHLGLGLITVLPYLMCFSDLGCVGALLFGNRDLYKASQKLQEATP